MCKCVCEYKSCVLLRVWQVDQLSGITLGISPCPCSDIPQRAQHTSMWLAYLYIQNITLTYTWQTHPVTPPPSHESLLLLLWVTGDKQHSNTADRPWCECMKRGWPHLHPPRCQSRHLVPLQELAFYIRFLLANLCSKNSVNLWPLTSIMLQHLAPQQFYGLLFRTSPGVGTQVAGVGRKRCQVSGNPLISLWKWRLQSMQCWESAIIPSQTKLCQKKRLQAQLTLTSKWLMDNLNGKNITDYWRSTFTALSVKCVCACVHNKTFFKKCSLISTLPCRWQKGIFRIESTQVKYCRWLACILLFPVVKT